MNEGYVKLAQDEIAPFNEGFLDMVENGEVKQAALSSQSFTRDRLREDSFTGKILTPKTISNTDLDKTEDPEFQVKWNDREPDLDGAPAVLVPLGVVPDRLQFAGTRYPSYFSRIMSPKLEKDIAKLRGYTYDIREVLLDISTKDIGTTIDTKFIETIDSVLGTLNTANSLNGLNLPQNVSISGGLTKENLVEAFKVIQRLRVPFGPIQSGGGESKGVMLMNNVTYADLLKFDRSEVGGDEAQTQYIEGLPVKPILGVPVIPTIKYDLIGDGEVYLFSSEDFLGKYYELQPLTVWMKNEAFFLEMFQYAEWSLAIGNVKGACRIQF